MKVTVSRIMFMLSGVALMLALMCMLIGEVFLLLLCLCMVVGNYYVADVREKLEQEEIDDD